jgi:hypothetical protein
MKRKQKNLKAKDKEARNYLHLKNNLKKHQEKHLKKHQEKHLKNHQQKKKQIKL